MVHLLKIWKPESVMQPCAAVHERHASHPVRVLVENEQVERHAHAAEEGVRDMVEIAGAIQRQVRSVRIIRQPFFTGALKSAECGEGTTHSNARSPIFKRG